jgi:hypothetical protein
MALVVELLSRSNTPLKHYLFEKDSITIGRGYNNDLRLSDPYVCANHLTIYQGSEQAQIEFSDLTSINGTRKNDLSCHKGGLCSDDVLTVGRTRLRVFNDARLVAPTVRLSELEERISWFSYFPVMLFLAGCYALMLLADAYLTSFTEFNLTKALPEIMGRILMVSIWPLSFALMAKLSKKESHLISQFSLIWIFLLALQALAVIKLFISFNLPSTDWWQWLELVIFAALLFLLFWFSLFIAFHQQTRRRNSMSVFFSAGLLLLLVVLSHFNGDDFSIMPSYDAKLLPPQYNLSTPASSEEFLLRSETLFDDLSKQLEKHEE